MIKLNSKENSLKEESSTSDKDEEEKINWLIYVKKKLNWLYLYTTIRLHSKDGEKRRIRGHSRCYKQYAKKMTTT